MPTARAAPPANAAGTRGARGTVRSQVRSTAATRPRPPHASDAKASDADLARSMGGPGPLLEPLVRRGGHPAEVGADASAKPTPHQPRGERSGERARVGRARVRARLEARSVALAGDDDVQRGPHPEESREPAGRLRRDSILVPVKARNVPDAVEGSSRRQRPGEAAEGLPAGGGRVHDHEPRPGGDAKRRSGLRVEPEVGEHAFRREPVSGQHDAHRIRARAPRRAKDGPPRGDGFPVRPRRSRWSGPRQRQESACHGRPRLAFRLRTPAPPRCGRRRCASPRAHRGRSPPRRRRGCGSRSRAGRTAR